MQVDETGWLVLFVALLTGASLFFSLNSLSLRTFSRVKLQESFKAARKEHLVDGFLEKAEDFILTCSFLRMVCNTIILLLLAALLSTRHYLLAFVVALVMLGVFVLAVPHSWAKHTGEYILPRTYPLLSILAWVVTPVLILFRLHDRFVRRLAGIHEATPDQAQEEKQEEILSVVEQGKIEGVVDEEEMEMIENVLELGDTTAEEIMTPRTDIVAVKTDDDLPQILETITKAGHSRLPVYEENIDNIIGFVYAKDLLSEIGKDPRDFKIKEKIRKAYFVPETKPLRSLLHEFQNQKLHISVVLDEYGGTAGIVTIEDILEELVGEIVDEYEKTPPAAFKKIDDTTVEVDARMYIDDLNSKFDVELPEDEDYDTVGGFVFSHLGYIPKTGQSFEYENLRFKITAAKIRKIERIKIHKINLSENLRQ